MSLLDRLLGVLAPYDCLGCGAEGRLLCNNCVQRLHVTAPCCYRCRMASPASLTCQGCCKTSGLEQVRSAAVYEGLAKDLVWKLKFAHAQSAAREIAARMSLLISHLETGTLLIVPVPTATTRIRQRGYDQACLLARELARQLRQPYVDVLARHSQTHQVGASRQQRLEQLARAFRVTKPHAIQGAHVLLVDDVVTTGATLEAAATVLKAAGAGRIEAVVFAQPNLRRAPIVR